MNIQEKALSAEKFFQDYRQVYEHRQELARKMEAIQAEIQQNYQDISRMEQIIQNYISSGLDIMTCILEYDDQKAREVTSLAQALGGNYITTSADIGLGTIDITSYEKYQAKNSSGRIFK